MNSTHSDLGGLTIPVHFTYPTIYPMMISCTNRFTIPTFLFLMCTILGVSYSKAASASALKPVTVYLLVLSQQDMICFTLQTLSFNKSLRR